MLAPLKTYFTSPSLAMDPECADRRVPGADGVVWLRGAFAHKHFHLAKRFHRELEILQHLCPSSYVAGPVDVDVENLIIVFPRYETDLMQCLLSDDAAGRMDRLLTATSLTKGVQYCHTVGLVHRDVKPENCLLSITGEATLCDFARARYAPEPIRVPFCGTQAYGAPEALAGHCCLANDIWSLGVVFYCMTERLYPFEDDVYPRAADVTFTAPAWQSEEGLRFCALIRALLMEEPLQRPDARECVRRLHE
jgi:serine/threonine protein kinase